MTTPLQTSQRQRSVLEPNLHENIPQSLHKTTAPPLTPTEQRRTTPPPRVFPPSIALNQTLPSLPPTVPSHTGLFLPLSQQQRPRPLPLRCVPLQTSHILCQQGQPNRHLPETQPPKRNTPSKNCSQCYNGTAPHSRQANHASAFYFKFWPGTTALSASYKKYGGTRFTIQPRTSPDTVFSTNTTSTARARTCVAV